LDNPFLEPEPPPTRKKATVKKKAKKKAVLRAKPSGEAFNFSKENPAPPLVLHLPGVQPDDDDEDTFETELLIGAVSHQKPPKPEPERDFILSFDGGSRGNPGASARAFIISDKAGNVIYSRAERIEDGTCNQAEWRAADLGVLTAVSDFGIKSLLIQGDSKLVIEQLAGRYACRSKNLQHHLRRVKGFVKFQLGGAASFRHVPREQNTEADALVNQVLDSGIDLIEPQGPLAEVSKRFKESRLQTPTQGQPIV